MNNSYIIFFIIIVLLALSHKQMKFKTSHCKKWGAIVVLVQLVDFVRIDTKIKAS